MVAGDDWNHDYPVEMFCNKLQGINLLIQYIKNF